MYLWLWHRLPGQVAAKAASIALIAAAVLALLWFFVFPWAAVTLPVDSSGL
jgi:predicted small integral membrane protein